ncbi:MAG: TatD family hydrolase, partial [Oscillospiraceae bacterium]|nr:TatD family hydrolase [Oscillospiraceae bacterium]
YADTMALIARHGVPKAGLLLHCFTGEPASLREVLAMGAHVSLGGAVTFRNARKLLAIAESVPDDRLMVETDCPYMAPEPMRGGRNDSRNLIHVVAKIAEIRGASAEGVARLTHDNAVRFYGIRLGGGAA